MMYNVNLDLLIEHGKWSMSTSTSTSNMNTTQEYKRERGEAPTLKAEGRGSKGYF